MRAQARVVVIGGGLIGCSILYHLTRLGWTDVVLLERDELTSGSTWHAAAGIHGLHDTNNISRLQYGTLKLYAELEQETGQSCGIVQPGTLYLAQTPDREHQLRLQAAKARYYGVDFHELSIQEAGALHPLIDFSGIRCVMFEPDGGHVDPSGVTHAYARGARANGAEIQRFTPVTGTTQRGDGSWEVVTPASAIHAEIVVNAAGLWGREVARMAGIELPLIPIEHQYFVTETIGEIAALDRRLPSVADRDGEYYLRQEGNGLLVGAYERQGRWWAEAGTPLDFGHDLLPDDLDRIEENVLRACRRLPVLADAGIKRVVNGPMIWAPDGSALFGPVPELRNYYCCNGIIPGFSQSGGLGGQLARWIVEGEPELDLFGWDLARYGAWADAAFTRTRSMETYGRRYAIHFPYEERPAGRPVRTRPAYERQRAMGAAFGLHYGWEVPSWFGGSGPSPRETFGFERQAWFGAVAAECRALRQAAGVIDVSHFAKYRARGNGAGAWLDRVLAGRLPVRDGRTRLAPLLGVRGGIAGDFTVTRLAEDDYVLIGSGQAERYHRRFFDAVPRPAGVAFDSLTVAWTGVNVAGPQSRTLLSRLTNANLANEAFPFMSARRLNIAGVEALALRLSFSGDLGWEMYVPESDQLALHDALFEAGAGLGLRAVGSRALLSLRLEKGYGSWGREYSPEMWPQEVGFARLIAADKDRFLGREALLRLKDTPPRELPALFEVDAEGADAAGGEPIFLTDGRPVGRVTSGAFGHWVGKSLALGFIDPDHHAAGLEVDIAILGRPHRARQLAGPPFDPDGRRLRG